MKVEFTFKGKLAGALGTPYYHHVTATIPHMMSDDDLRIHCLYNGNNDSKQKFDHLELQTIKVKILRVGDEVVDLKAMRDGLPDAVGKIISIEGNDIRVEYNTGVVRLNFINNLVLRKDYIINHIEEDLDYDSIVDEREGA